MRFTVGFVIVILLLSASLAAQTPAQIPGAQPGAPSTPPDTQTPAGQAPQAPGAPALPGKPPGGENQLFLEVKTGYYNNEISPDTRGPDGRPDRSFLTPGNNVFADFTYFQDQAFGGANRIQVLGIYRNTNDIRVDPEQNSFQRGYLRFITPTSEVNLGDYLVNYSRFTFNQNIRGLHLTHKFNDNFKLMANGGVYTDRWGSIFKDDLIGKPYTRIVAGLRAETRFSPDKIVGFNFSHGRDQISSIRRDLQTGLLGVDNQIVSIDSKLAFSRVFTMDGELAYSVSNPDIARLHGRQEDYGARVDTTTRQGPFFLRTTFTRMMPDFLSVNARQLADLQDWGFRGGTDLGSHATVEGAYRQTSNNLLDLRPEGTTTFRVPEVRVSLRQLPHLGRTIMEMGYRERRQQGPLRTGSTLLEDRNTRIPFIDVSIPISSTLITAGYEFRRNVDFRNPSQNTDTNRVSFSLRSIFDLRGWSVSPLFRYEIERELFFRVLGANNNRNIQAAVYIEAPKYLVLEGQYKQIGASLFSECLTTASDFCGLGRAFPAGTVILLPSGFGRPAWRGALTYKIANSDNKNIIFSVERNTNVFALPGSTIGNPAKNFDERVIAVTFLYRWKR